MEKIRSFENDSIKQPQDKLDVHLQLSNNVEEVREYLDDSDNVLAQTMNGLLYRIKLKVTLSYKQPPGSIGLGLFRDV